MGLRLVIDREAIREVVVVLGPIELPLTREQLIAVLFDEPDVATIRPKIEASSMYGAFTKSREVVPATSKKKSQKKAASKLQAKPPPKSSTTLPNKFDLCGEILRAIGVISAKTDDLVSLPELREYFETHFPEYVKQRYKISTTLASALHRLVQAKEVRQKGKRGSYRYGLTATKDKALNGIASEVTS